MIKRNACLNACFLQHTKKFEYVVFEQKDSLIKYNYCVMQTYFHIDVAFVIILSVVRTMQVRTIAYGYKLHIMLFQKHRNIKKSFQKNTQKAMQDNFKRRKR